MKKIIILLNLLVLQFVSIANTPTEEPPVKPMFATYYIATTGNDAGAGTIGDPWKTFDRLSSSMSPGDICYVRGGTYRSVQPASYNYRFQIDDLNGTSGSRIRIENYAGEIPIINLDDILCTGEGPTGMYITNSTYVTFKGIRITGLAQLNGGSPVAGLNITGSDNCIIENVEVDHCGGYGFYNTDSDNTLFLNCDAHHLDDRYSGWTNSNGFNCTGGDPSTGVVFENCRAWWCSDDGYDLFSTNGLFTFKNCWSFWNGYQPGTFITAGDGSGFKFGPVTTSQAGNLRRIVNGCFAFENRLYGFDQNSAQCKFELYNNTSFNNGLTGYNFIYHQGITQQSKNNLSWQDPLEYDGNNIAGSFNSWSGGVTVTNGDFQSISSTGADAARLADGSLPTLTFMKLVSGSDLINAGQDQGFGDDIGAFQFGGNVNPTAAAGANQSITLPTSSVTVNGSGSSDPDGTITAYAWTKISGPATYTITSPTASSTTITGLTTVGVYVFRLTVTDDDGATAFDDVQIGVNPEASAGNDNTHRSPVRKKN